MADLKTDSQLIEAAAIAGGLGLGHWDDAVGAWNYQFRSQLTDSHYWNPLTDDGDALRLAAMLRLNIMQGDFSVGVNDEGEIDEAAMLTSDVERCACIRRLTVIAAAKVVVRCST